MVKIDFNPNEHEGQGGGDFEPIKPGWYACQIIDSEERETKAGTGSYLRLTLELVADHHPELSGRLLWVNLNLNNPNPTAVEIAQDQLADICRAVGVGELNDTEDLHFKPLAVKVAVKRSAEYGDGNECKRFEPLAARFGAQTKPTPKPKPSAGKAKPWGK